MPENMKRVWVKNGATIKPVTIETGVTDGMTIEIISGLNEGDMVITSMEMGSTIGSDYEESEETQKSPFVQERPGRPGK